MIEGPFNKIINNQEELSELFGTPSDMVNNKVIDFIDEHIRSYISKTPILFISTANSDGLCDVSPRGDQAGFVYIVDNKHLVIPERPGNRRFDSLCNIISNPNIGLIFIIPGLEETLRINGQACVINDDDILSQLLVRGKRPWLGIGVKVEQCFIHCAKAFKRSGIWNSNTWLEPDNLPVPARILVDHINKGYSEDDIRKALQESYEKRMY